MSSERPPSVAELVEHSNDLLYSFAPDGRIEALYGPVQRISGYSTQQLVGRNVFELIEPADLDVARRHHEDKLRGRAERTTYELRLRHADGTARWFEISSAAVRKEGRMVAVQGILRDVSERHRAQADRAAAEKLQRDLWENANDILYTHDMAGRFTDVNRAALDTFGYTRSEFLALSIVGIVHPDDLPIAQGHLRAKLEGREERAAPYELRTRAKDGHIVWAEVSTRIVRDPAGRPVAVHGIVRDITARKAAEARTALVQRTARELGHAKDFTAALQATLDSVCEAAGWAYGEAWVPDAEGLMMCSPASHLGKPGLEKLRSLSSKMRFERTEGLAGTLWTKKAAMAVPDLTQEQGVRRNAAAQAAGLNSLIAVPIIDDGDSVADLVFMNTAWRPGDESWVALLDTIATQLASVLALRRRQDQLRRQARLFTAQLRANPTPALAVDPQGNLLWANQRLLDLAGVRMKDGVRFGLDRVRFLDLVDQPQRLSDFAARACESADSKLPIGGRVFERIDAALRDDEGSLGHVWYFRDVTQQSLGR